MTASTTYICERPPLRIVCAAPVPRAAAERWLLEAPAWAAGGFRSLRSAGEPPAFVKLRGEPGWRGWLQWVSGRRSRAKRDFELGVAIADAGVRTARPLAYLEERRGPAVAWSCLLVELIEAPTLRATLLELARQAGDGPAPPAARRPVLEAVAREVARLHAAGFRQRDLKALNVLVERSAGGACAAALVDLEGMSRVVRPAREAVRARDLARLAVSLRESEVAAAGVSPEDWRHCLRTYLEAADLPRGDEEVERWFATTLDWAAHKEARNRRRGRETL